MPASNVRQLEDQRHLTARRTAYGELEIEENARFYGFGSSYTFANLVLASVLRQAGFFRDVHEPPITGQSAQNSSTDEKEETIQ